MKLLRKTDTVLTIKHFLKPNMRWTEEIEKEALKGNAKAIWQGVKSLCGTKKSFATKQPTKNSKGSRIASPAELANAWKKFSEKKFSPTELERLQRQFEDLPDNDGKDKLERKEFDEAVKHMKMEKRQTLTKYLLKYGKTRR